MEGLDWLRLIFHWCDFTSLLRLRAACTLFRTVLSLPEANDRVWRRHTSWVLPRLHHDERALGWRGVVAAMAREERVRTNCVTGRYEEFVVSMHQAIACMYIIGDRLLMSDALTSPTTNLHDLNTGALIAQIKCGYVARNSAFEDMAPSAIILDRWIPFMHLHDDVEDDRFGQWVLLDCATGTLGTEVITTVRNSSSLKFGASGVHFSHRQVRGTTVCIYHVARPSQIVRRLELDNYQDTFELCRNGESFTMAKNRSIALYDVQTGLVMRVIDDRYDGAGLWISPNRMFFKYHNSSRQPFVYHLDNELPFKMTRRLGDYFIANNMIRQHVYGGDLHCNVIEHHNHYLCAKTNATVCIPNSNDGRMFRMDEWSGACVNYDVSSGFAVFRRSLTNFDEAHAIHVNSLITSNDPNAIGPFNRGVFIFRLTRFAVKVFRFDK